VTLASALDQHVEDLALVIDGAPEIHPLAGDAHHHLVEMPAIARPRATLAPTSRDRGHPAPHRFVGDVEPSHGKQLLDIAVAQGEAEIEPDRVLNDLGREAMAAVAERAHADILSDTPLASDPVSMTMPFTTPSTFNVISSPDPHCGASGPKLPQSGQDAVAAA